MALRPGPAETASPPPPLPSRPPAGQAWRGRPAALSRARIDALVLDPDGVLADSAALHRAAWKATLDPVLARHAARSGEPARPFGTAECLAEALGRPRLEAVRAVLSARGLCLPEGGPHDPADAATVHGLARGKDARFRAALADGPPAAFAEVAAFLARARALGFSTAVASAGRHAHDVLSAAGLADCAAVIVDGSCSAPRGLGAGPEPGALAEAVGRLGVAPARAAVLSASPAGIRAARAAGFARVVGIAREGQGQALAAAGADTLARDLAALRLEGRPPRPDARLHGTRGAAGRRFAGRDG